MAFESFGMGRLLKPDPRDHRFPLSAVTPAPPPSLRKKAWATGGPAWDQGDTSRCCSFGTNRWLVASPVRNAIWLPLGMNPLEFVTLERIVDFDWRINDFYDRIRAADGFPMPHEGSTVRACFEVLRAAGYVAEYRWAFTAAGVAAHLLARGPVVCGVDWTVPMFSPTHYGRTRGTFVRVHADDGRYDVAGGHCVCAYAANLDGWCPDGTRGWVEFVNSWGTDWGLRGAARLSLADLAILANNAGEFAAAVEVRVGKRRAA